MAYIGVIHPLILTIDPNCQPDIQVVDKKDFKGFTKFLEFSNQFQLPHDWHKAIEERMHRKVLVHRGCGNTKTQAKSQWHDS